MVLQQLWGRENDGMLLRIKFDLFQLALTLISIYNPLLEFSFVYQYKIFNVGRSKTKPKSHRILKFVKLKDSLLDNE